MSNIKYSAIIGSLGQTCDRFMKCGYKDLDADKVEFPDIIKNLEKMQVLKAQIFIRWQLGRCLIPIR